MKNNRSRDFGRAVAVRRWTPAAIECLERGCRCEGCYYKDFFKQSETSGYRQKCQLKASVVELQRTIGPPEYFNQKTIIDDTNIKIKEQIMAKIEERKRVELSETAQNIINNELKNSKLSEREKEIAGLILDGQNKHKIAKDLEMQPQTVNVHLSSIFSKTAHLVNYVTNRDKTNEFLNFFLGGSKEFEAPVIKSTELENAPAATSEIETEVIPKQAYYDFLEKVRTKNGTVNTAPKSEPKTLKEIVEYYNGLDKQILDCENLIKLYQDKKENFVNEKNSFGNKIFQEIQA